VKEAAAEAFAILTKLPPHESISASAAVLGLILYAFRDCDMCTDEQLNEIVDTIPKIVRQAFAEKGWV